MIVVQEDSRTSRLVNDLQSSPWMQVVVKNFFIFLLGHLMAHTANISIFYMIEKMDNILAFSYISVNLHVIYNAAC